MTEVWSSRSTSAAASRGASAGFAARRLGRGEGSSLHRSLRLVVTELNTGLGQLADDGPGLGGGYPGLLECGAELREGQVTLAAPALDQLVHVGHGGLIVVSLRRGRSVPRHETPPSPHQRAPRTRCSSTTGAAPSVS